MQKEKKNRLYKKKKSSCYSTQLQTYTDMWVCVFRSLYKKTKTKLKSFITIYCLFFSRGFSEWHLCEKVGNRFSIMCTTNCFRKHHWYIDYLKYDYKRKFKTFFFIINNTWILFEFFIFSSCGIVFVTTTASNGELLILDIAGPLKIPCEQIA